MIHLSELSKHYRVHEKEAGLKGSLRAFVRRRHKLVRAVEVVSFEIAAGGWWAFSAPTAWARPPS